MRLIEIYIADMADNAARHCRNRAAFHEDRPYMSPRDREHAEINRQMAERLEKVALTGLVPRDEYLIDEILFVSSHFPWRYRIAIAELIRLRGN